MNVSCLLKADGKPRATGFTLVEAMVAVAVVGIVFMALYSGIAWGIKSVQMARENLRATQVMLEKMEVIRVLTWSQITSNNFLPTKFTARYDPNPANAGYGPTFEGTLIITNVPATMSYSNDLRLVKVKVRWKTGDTPRSREMETYFSKYGVQNYIYETGHELPTKK